MKIAKGQKASPDFRQTDHGVLLVRRGNGVRVHRGCRRDAGGPDRLALLVLGAFWTLLHQTKQVIGARAEHAK
jgi:hypothetical protein